MSFKTFSSRQNANILPCYKLLLREKQKCYPREITIEAHQARVSIQSLVEHTLNKVFLAIESELNAVVGTSSSEIIECSCEFSYGFDGSSGFSQFQQELNTQRSDKSLFVSSLCLLRVKSTLFGNLWVNPSPSSVRFNRPIWLIYEKETDKLTEYVDKALKEEIKNMKNFTIKSSSGQCFSFEEFKFSLTLIDGKIMAFLCGTSTQACPNCKALPKDMKNIEKVKNQSFKITEESKALGMSILHTEIQIFNSLYNTAAKKSTKNPRGGQTDEVKEQKNIIRARFKLKMNLLVDLPNPSGGSTTTGNTARRAFSDVEKFAECLGFNENEKEIIIRIRNILLCLKSGYDLNNEKFKEYCHTSHLMWFDLFPWSSPSPYTHRLFVHAPDIYCAFPLPLAMYTEEASEAKNKYYKQDRQMHARKTSKIHNITDIIHRSFESSDYKISINFFKSRKILKSIYPQDVQDIFLDKSLEDSSIEEGEIEDEMDLYADEDYLNLVEFCIGDD